MQWDLCSGTAAGICSLQCHHLPRCDLRQCWRLEFEAARGSFFFGPPPGGHSEIAPAKKGAPTLGRILQARPWVKCPFGTTFLRPSPLGLKLSGGRHHRQRLINACDTIALVAGAARRCGKRLGIPCPPTHSLILAQYPSGIAPGLRGASEKPGAQLSFPTAMALRGRSLDRSTHRNRTL